MDRKPAEYERQKEMSRDWKKANPERHAELACAYRARNREKTAAQNKLNYAIRKGLIQRQPCQKCDATEKVHAHHHDYSKPLDVEWFCYACHRKQHHVDEEEKKVKFEGASKARLPGESNPNASLSTKDVRQIRAMLDAGVSQQKIAMVFGINQTTVSRIKIGRTYQDIS